MTEGARGTHQEWLLGSTLWSWDNDAIWWEMNRNGSTILESLIFLFYNPYGISAQNPTTQHLLIVHQREGRLLQMRSHVIISSLHWELRDRWRYYCLCPRHYSLKIPSEFEVTDKTDSVSNRLLRMFS